MYSVRTTVYVGRHRPFTTGRCVTPGARAAMLRQATYDARWAARRIRPDSPRPDFPIRLGPIRLGPIRSDPTRPDPLAGADNGTAASANRHPGFYRAVIGFGWPGLDRGASGDWADFKDQIACTIWESGVMVAG